MINRTYFKDFKPAYNAGERMTLPAGVYEGHIIAAKLDMSSNVPTLVIQVEIDKGEYAGFFRRQYDSQKNGQYAAKYKGVYRVQLPDGQDQEHDSWRQQQLEGVVWALENGNPGYHWNWDENTMKGLKVGLNVRERDYYYEKRFGTTTEIGRLESVAMMNDPDENKRPKPMKKRELSTNEKRQKEQDEGRSTVTAYTPSGVHGGGYVEVDDDELPF